MHATNLFVNCTVLSAVLKPGLTPVMTPTARGTWASRDLHPCIVIPMQLDSPLYLDNTRKAPQSKRMGRGSLPVARLVC